MKNLFTTKNLVLIALFGAFAALLMLLEFPMLIIAPEFYKLDVSEIPVMVGTFSLGPVAGVIIELIKILLKLLIKGTSTMYVGDFANFCVGLCYILPAGIIYSRKKTKKNAMIGMAVGTLVMAIAGAILNYFVMLPFYESAFGMPMEKIIAAGTAVNPLVKSKFTFVAICVVPFNIIKGIIVSVLTALIYKRISTLIKEIRIGRKNSK